MHLRATIFCALALAGTTATAQDRIALSQAVYVENLGQGGNIRTIEPARRLKRGDRVILMIEWTGAEARMGTTVRSAIPTNLVFQQSSSEALEVSVDGGRKWGRIGDLQIGERLAVPEEVTHVRLRLHGRTGGQLTYSAIVR